MASSSPSTRSERPQSVIWRSGSIAGSSDRGSSTASGAAGRARCSLTASSGSRRRASVGQSGAHTMSSSSHSSRFHGCWIVAAVIPASPAFSRFTGESSIRTSIADLEAARDLVVGAVELVVREADLLQPALGGGVRVGRAVGGDVDEVAGLVPARIASTAPGYGSAASTLASRWVSATQTLELLGPQPRDPPRELLVVGQVDAEAALGDRGELVPVVVQRGVDVDRDAHGPLR